MSDDALEEVIRRQDHQLTEYRAIIHALLNRLELEERQRRTTYWNAYQQGRRARKEDRNPVSIASPPI